jgi:N-dimethylarginine dimethylaminohydrolase
VTQVERKPQKRTFLMCSPEHFTVEYAINPWMDIAEPVDGSLAVKQWQSLRDAVTGLGHEVYELAPQSGLPDMVFAANGAFSVDGTVYGARFKYPQRSAEAEAHRRWYTEMGWNYLAPTQVNEGEGDFAYVPGAFGGLILAGYGFRTEPSAHAEAQETLSRPVISLRLVDPRFYHLDVALASLDGGNIAYFPGAFSPQSQRVLEQLFPDAVVATEADALAFGLNLVGDGYHVFLNAEAGALAATLEEHGYRPVPVDLSELKKGGGSVKCCMAELRI